MDTLFVKGECTMKKHFNKRIAGGLAIALAVTGSLSLLTPPLNSDSPKNISLFSDNSSLSITAQASTPVRLTEDDLAVSGGTVTGFTASGSAMIANITTPGGILLEFPSTLTASKIGANAFKGKFKDREVSIKLPNSITYIGDGAFSENTKLTSIEFGNNLQTIGKNAFKNDSALASLDLKTTVQTLGEAAFAYTGITGELTIPNSVTSMGKACFCEVRGLTKVTFPASLAKIPQYAFYGDENLTEVVFNEGLKSIGTRAFQNCSIATNFNLPNSLEVLGQECFDNNKITSVTLPDNIKEVYSNVFSNNEITTANFGALTIAKAPALEYPGTLEAGVVPRGIFANNKLSSISFPSHIHTIGADAFKGNNFTSYTVPVNVTTIGDGAFDENKSLSSITLHNDIKVIGMGAFRNCDIHGVLNYLPTNLKELGNEAFRGNKITRIKLPDNIEYLGQGVFADNQITAVALEDWGKYDKVDSFAYEYDPDDNNSRAGGIVIPDNFFDGNNISSLQLPASISAIGAYAFGHQSSTIPDVTIPADVMYIGNGAFYQTRVDNLIFAGKKMKMFGHNVFSSSHIQSDITIFNSIEKIGDGAFYGNDMAKVTFENADPQIGQDAFEACQYLSTVEGLDTRKLKVAAFTGSGLKHLTFDYAGLNPAFTSTEPLTFFSGKLRSVNFPASIKNIPQGHAPSGASYGSHEEISAFYKNLSWYPDSEEAYKKVALYRVGTDGTTYVTDNEVADGDYHVFNPVLVEFKLVDQDGNNLPKASLPQTIEGERTRTTTPSTVSTENFTVNKYNVGSDVKLVDYKNFKLADKIKFTLPATPAGFTFENVTISNSAINPVTGEADKYEVTLSPTDSSIVAEASYDDSDYKVGYKNTVITLRYKKTSGGTNPPSVTPTPPAITPTPPAITPTPPAVTPSNPGNPVVPLPDTPANPTTPDTPATPNIPSVNPPTNVPFTPDRIINPDLIPEGNPVFNIVDDKNTPLGDAKVNKDKGTYTFVDDGETPKGVAKIHDDNTLEVVKVFDNKTPQGSLPKTGGSNENVFVLLGGVLLGLGFVVRKKLK